MRSTKYWRPLFIKKYIKYNNSLFCVVNQADNNADSIHLLNSGFYQNFNFGFIVNDNPTVNKVFDTSEIVAKQNNSSCSNFH